MSFKDIVGQDNAIRVLKNAIERDEVPPCYIFSGPRGVGKSRVALEFAKAINCSNLENIDAGPCESCDSCRRISDFNHPDVLFISPTGRAKKAIKINQVRGLISQINLSPFQAKKKVFIIDEADSMTQEASNALLKTLEEPPQDSILILITSNINSILPTIASRCQLVRFFALPVNRVKRVLMEGHSMDEDRAHFIAHLSSGRVGEAVRLKSSGIFLKKNRIIDSLIKGEFSHAGLEAGKRDELEELLDVTLGWYRDLLICRSGMERSKLINIDRSQDLARQAPKVNFENLIGLITYIIECQGYLRRNVNAKLILSVLGIRVKRLEKCTR